MITTLYQVGGAGKASLFSTTQKGEKGEQPFQAGEHSFKRPVLI
tara:strand:- start:21393 stop:21524 length:132 start_codon:yes stop_codon:yes gene_type:complete